MRFRISFLFLLTFFLVCNRAVSTGQTLSFTEVTLVYGITGEVCSNMEYDLLIDPYPVHGEMRAVLNPLDNGTVAYESEYEIIDSATELTWREERKAGVLRNRVDLDGNYTIFYVNMPVSGGQSLYTLTDTVDAEYLGVRYVQATGIFVKSHYFYFDVEVSLGLLRIEWFFEWETGILLRFVKSIESNFIRVQWIDFTIETTTLNLTGSHLVTAFFANHRENFFAVFGAVITSVLLFFYIVRKKVGRGVLQ